LFGALKYPVPFSQANNCDLVPALMEGTTTVHLINREISKPPKCYLDTEQDVVDWLLQPLKDQERSDFISLGEKLGKHAEALHKGFHCSIMDLADDISFGIHDMEDSIALRLISEQDFRLFVSEESCSAHLDFLKGSYGAEFGNDVYEAYVRVLFDNNKSRKHAISRMVAHLIRSCRIETIERFETPMVRYRAGMEEKARKFLKALKEAVYKVVIRSPAVQHLEFKGQQMVVAVFEALRSEPRALLPVDTLALYDTSADPVRVVCDHVAGMTDTFLLKTYERLFSPRMGSIFDKL
ncbi:MAG TPA: hypothetical protein VHW69_00060, partial [Rhizomicrobium sp.]|nr:hypothetical protein [Rhizomicrobium sp.]